MTFIKVFGFDQTFKVTKVQVVFSGFNRSDLEKSVRTDMYNIHSSSKGIKTFKSGQWHSHHGQLHRAIFALTSIV